jgi:formylglycine-generating enzyme required for sulfatase activity
MNLGLAAAAAIAPEHLLEAPINNAGDGWPSFTTARRLAKCALITLLLLAVMLAAAPIAQAEKRVALVVGNSAYQHAGRLANPANDAADVAAALKKLGFQVIEGFDLDKAAFDRKVRDFAGALKGADAGVLFYAGHGMQVAGENYLVPIDAKAEDATALEFEMLRVAMIHRIMEQQTNTNILFLDACRDNPLARNLARGMGTRSTDVGSGLARIESGVGTLISFSTQPGNVALDGAGRNSPFAGALVKQLNSSADDLGAMLITVRNDVMKETQRKQVPWENSALTGRFYFGKPGPTAEPSKQVSLTTSPKPLGADEERSLKPGTAFKECEQCPEMVVLPPGEFTMGSPAAEEGRFANEGPQRKVTIGVPFAVGKFEVTFAEWDSCVAAAGCKHKPNDRGWGRSKRPAINVSWEDITKEYLPWLARKTGKTYRLLTEAEWEYAARAGTTTPYSTGTTITVEQANFFASVDTYRKETIDVGALPANAFGLHDMHGNVWEWVQDCFKEGYAGTPTDGSAMADAADCPRVLRGGAWSNEARALRSASRHRDAAYMRDADFGFRLARTLGR